MRGTGSGSVTMAASVDQVEVRRNGETPSTAAYSVAPSAHTSEGGPGSPPHGTLGSEVVQGADQLAAAGQPGGEAVARVLHGGDTEVGEHDPPGAQAPTGCRFRVLQQDVAGLDVTVQHAHPVRGGERVQHLRSYPGRLVRAERPAAVQHVGERGAFDQLHDDDGAPLVLGHVVDGDDPGVAHPGGGARLALHPGVQGGEFGLARVAVGAQFLDRHLAREHFVDRAPDRSHAATAQLAAHPVAADEQPAFARVPALGLLFPRFPHRAPSPCRGHSAASSCGGEGVSLRAERGPYGSCLQPRVRPASVSRAVRSIPLAFSTSAADSAPQSRPRSR